MKQYIILSRELFNIKKGILDMVVKHRKQGLVPHTEIMLETGRQLRFDLEQLKNENFLNITVSPGDQRLIKKINDRIMIKYAVLKRRFEKDIAAMA